MKHYLIILIILSAHSTINAQFNKGNYIVGGSFSTSFLSPGAAHEYHVEFDPKLGYYFINRVAAGINVVGDISKSSNGAISKYYGAGPFVRYNFWDKLFTEADYNYVIDDEKFPNADKSGYDKTSFDENQYTLGLGYVILLTRHIALEPKISYSVDSAFGEIISQGPGLSISFHSYL